MKINFDGQFKDVLRVVNSPVKADPGEAKVFTKLLGEFEPQAVKPAEIIKDFGPTRSALQFEDSSVMARYNFKEPELEKPKIFSDPNPPSDVKTTSLGVKPPHVVSAHRTAARPKLSEDSIHKLIDGTGVAVGVDPALSLAVAKTESSFNPAAISSDGHASKGLFQLLDSTGKQLHSKLEMTNRYDPFNPTQNTKLGVEYLRYLHEIFSTQTDLPNALSTVPAANSSSLEKLAVAAFNAGEGRVASAQARAKRAGMDPAEYQNVAPYLPDTTQQYVQRVLEFREQFGKESEDGQG